jgi:hypothetical protein
VSLHHSAEGTEMLKVGTKLGPIEYEINYNYEPIAPNYFSWDDIHI